MWEAGSSFLAEDADIVASTSHASEDMSYWMDHKLIQKL